MPITFAIPKHLSGFAPIFEWLSGIPEEELNEELDLTEIESFLRSRYGDLECDDVEERLKSDRQAFDELVDAEGTRCPWLYFFQASLISAPHILANLQPPEPEENQFPPPLILHVELPEDFDIENDFGSVRARKASVTVELAPTSESVLDFRLQNLRLRSKWQEERQEPPFCFTVVDWNVVTGWKITSRIRALVTRSSHTYLGCPAVLAWRRFIVTILNLAEHELENSLRSASVETTS